MPQLDKYIFFTQIINLTFFFALIYIYIRGTVVPKLSSLLKYRKKKIISFNNEIENYSKILSSFQKNFDKNAKIYISFLSENLRNTNNLYNYKVDKENYNLFKILNKPTDLINHIVVTDYLESKRINKNK